MKKKILADCIILLIVAVFVFFIGWLQISVKAGSCGVMVSKTGGIYEKPVLPGSFTWRWERLLPTNVDLRIFKTAPYTSKQVVSGSLPSAELYRAQIKDNPDFSYRATLSVTLSATPQNLIALVQKYDIRSQEDLEKVFDQKAAVAAKKVMEYFIDQKEIDLSFSANAVTDEELADLVRKNENDFDYITIIAVEAIDARIPDLSLYRTAKESFLEYQKTVDAELKKHAGEQALSIIEEDRSMERLEKLGQLLQKYPQLQDIFKNGDVSSIMNAVKSFR